MTTIIITSVHVMEHLMQVTTLAGNQQRRFAMIKTSATLAMLMVFMCIGACGDNAVTSQPSRGGSTIQATGGTGGHVTSGGTSAITTNGGAAGMTQSMGGTMGGTSAAKSGGVIQSGGNMLGGTTGTTTGGATSVCPYSVSSFTCAAACKNLQAFTAKCEDEPTLPTDIQIMFAMYGHVPEICTSTCALVSESAPKQWECFQGAPSDASCKEMMGCSSANCM
jgi:hypothetical protein